MRGLWILFALPFVLGLAGVSTVRAAESEEKVEIKKTTDDGKKEVKMKVTKKGDNFVVFQNNKEYILRGESAAKLSVEGDYFVSGRVADDKFYEVTEIRPAVVAEKKVIHEP